MLEVSDGISRKETDADERESESYSHVLVVAMRVEPSLREPIIKGLLYLYSMGA